MPAKALKWLVSAGGTHGEIQQLGTDLQSGRLGRLVVDLEADFAGFLDKVDHAARFNKAICVADREHWYCLQILDDFTEAFLFQIADEKDLAMGALGGAFKKVD